MVWAHDDAVAHSCPALNDAANADHAAFQMRIGDDAAIGDDCLSQSGAINLAAGQKSRMRVDWRVWLEEAVLGHDIGEIEIGLIERANCSNVLPVTVEDICADMSILDRLRDHVF